MKRLYTELFIISQKFEINVHMYDGFYSNSSHTDSRQLLLARKTVYQTFELSIPLFVNSSFNIKIQLKKLNIIKKKTDIFIWDKAPMHGTSIYML